MAGRWAVLSHTQQLQMLQLSTAAALLPPSQRGAWAAMGDTDRRLWLELRAYRASLSPVDWPAFDGLDAPAQQLQMRSRQFERDVIRPLGEEARRLWAALRPPERIALMSGDAAAALPRLPPRAVGRWERMGLLQRAEWLETQRPRASLASEAMVAQWDDGEEDDVAAAALHAAWARVSARLLPMCSAEEVRSTCAPIVLAMQTFTPPCVLLTV